jgi:PelA/Pel-15E family pectate lyase
MRSNSLVLAALLVAPAAFAAEADFPLQTHAALQKATAYLRSISTEGGYLWRYSLDLQQRAGESKATATQIWIQPPGTPSVGMAFLRAHEATKDTRYLDAARAAADALARGQLESGGWDYLIEFDPTAGNKWYRRADAGRLSPADAAKRRNISTYDDNNTQSALRFLLAYCDAVKGSTDPRETRIREALDYGLTKMLEAQYPNGAWPQRYDGIPKRVEDFPVKPAAYPRDYPRIWPHTDYKGHYTFNDNTHRDCIATMLDAYHRTGKREFLDAAKRGGDFIVLAQMPEPQPGWAQQYNARMEPAWARAFEPPSITGGESVGALRMLMDLYVETGEEKYLKPIPAALAWFDRAALAPNRWARYYELHTNKQLFGDRDGKIYYRLADISEERQKGYSWSGDYGVRNMMAYYDKVKMRSRETLLKEKVKKPASVKSLEPRARQVVAAQDEQGRWVTKGNAKKRDWEFTDYVEATVFIKNLETLAAYLEAVK